MNRIGIDTGGTFTDAVLLQEDAVYTFKTPTTDDLLTGIIRAYSGVCDTAGIDVSEVTSINHGSTVALNTILEEAGPPTALIATSGFADVLEIGEGFRDSSMLYSPCGPNEAPLIPRAFRFDVTERVTADGEVLTPLDSGDVDRIIGELEESGIQSVAICLLHAYSNPIHEERLAERIRDALPGMTIDLSSQTSPRIREYHRMCTTVVSAYVKPRIQTYLSELQSQFDDLGVTSRLNIMKSDGGMARADIAADRPFTQIISGPVAGVKGIQFISDAIDRENVITFDMGGTSCDTSLITGGSLVEKHTESIRDMVVNGPIIDVDTIGAGGGSIAWVNDAGALRVGPTSAGADPGPVCYGNGGVEPTVTDADLLLGYLDPDNFAGGLLELDEEATRDSVRDRIADPLDMDVTEAALAIRRVIDSKMASAVRVKSVQQGHDPRSFSLVGYGGAGPLHASAIADELGITEIVFPNNPGLLSAFGLTISDIKHTYEHSVVQFTSDLDTREVTEVVGSLLERGHGELTEQGVPVDRQRFSVVFDMMYAGQAHQLSIPVITECSGDSVGAISVDQELIGTVVARFTAQHDQLYGFTDDAAQIEVVNARVVAEGLTEKPGIDSGSGSGSVDEAARGERTVRTSPSTDRDVLVYRWGQAPVNATIDGPAIIESDNTTAWIPAAFTARTDEAMNIIASRGDQ